MSDSCDFTVVPEDSPSDERVENDRLWHSLARYRVYRAQYGKPNQVMHTGLTYAEAKDARDALERLIRAEPGYRPACMGSPHAGLEMENYATAYPRYRELIGNPIVPIVPTIHHARGPA